MIKDANPQEKSEIKIQNSKQTVEIRSGDGSADVYLYVAAIIVAAQHGLQMPNALKLAQDLYVNVNIFHEEHKEKLASLKGLPISCHESAIALEAKRKFFEKNGIFKAGLIDSTIKMLKSYNDEKLSEELFGKNDEIYKLVMNHLHCM